MNRVLPFPDRIHYNGVRHTTFLVRNDGEFHNWTYLHNHPRNVTSWGPDDEPYQLMKKWYDALEPGTRTIEYGYYDSDKRKWKWKKVLQSEVDCMPDLKLVNGSYLGIRSATEEGDGVPYTSRIGMVLTYKDVLHNILEDRVWRKLTPPRTIYMLGNCHCCDKDHVHSTIILFQEVLND